MTPHNLTRENYFDPENQIKYWGSSQFKDFMKCETAAMDKLKNGDNSEPGKALIQGQYLDSYFEGNRNEFEKTHKIINTKGNRYADFEVVQRAFDRIMEDEEMARLCLGMQQQIYTGQIEGIDFKIMIDSLLPGEAIVDRKLLKDFKDIWDGEEFVPFWKYWGYDIQAYIYQTIYEQNTGDKLPFLLACVTKETVPSIEVFQFSDETIQKAGEQVRKLIQGFDDVKIGLVEPYACGVCDYCKSKYKIEQGRYREI